MRWDASGKYYNRSKADLREQIRSSVVDMSILRFFKDQGGVDMLAVQYRKRAGKVQASMNYLFGSFTQLSTIFIFFFYVTGHELFM